MGVRQHADLGKHLGFGAPAARRGSSSEQARFDEAANGAGCGLW